MTFSIAALCPRTGAFGCAIATSSMAAGARVPFVAPGFGVVLTQARTDPALGALGLGGSKPGVRPPRRFPTCWRRRRGMPPGVSWQSSTAAATSPISPVPR